MIINKPLWDESPIQQKFPSLEKNIATDICIVGAGITGISLAYKLTKAGKKVVVIDKGKVGFGETGLTTAHLTMVLDDRYFEIKKKRGIKKARKILTSHSEAITIIEEIINEENIDCDFQRLDGYLLLSKGDDEKVLDKELKTLKEIGFEGVTKVKETPLTPGPSLKFANQGQFHPLKYLQALTKSIIKNGGQIYVDTFVDDVEENPQGVSIKIAKGLQVEARRVVIATNSPFNDRLKMHTKQAAYRSYVIAAEAPKDQPNGLYWDMKDPYHYLRFQEVNKKQYLIIGGEDHKTGQEENTEEKYQKLLDWSKKMFPDWKLKIAYQWSGQIIEAIDRCAYIGKNPGNKHIYIATGYSGNGMTYGNIAAQIIGDQLLGRKNQWEKLYEPSRKNWRGTFTFLSENFNVACQYLAAHSIKKSTSTEIKKLPIGMGMVFSDGGKKMAIYRDPKGRLNKCSAICTHLGCTVQWNKEAVSWDCPCHGSRFTPEGKVINGPAKYPLKQMDT